jgi:hypothetical protein
LDISFFIFLSPIFLSASSPAPQDAPSASSALSVPMLGHQLNSRRVGQRRAVELEVGTAFLQSITQHAEPPAARKLLIR